MPTISPTALFTPDAPATIFIGGVECKINDQLRITPNTIVTTYGASSEGVRPRTDWHLHLTLFLDFE